jgi:hypothetical protein
MISPRGPNRTIGCHKNPLHKAGFCEWILRQRALLQNNGTVLFADAWPQLVLTAVLQVYLGLSAVAHTFTGLLQPPPGSVHGWWPRWAGSRRLPPSYFRAGCPPRSSRRTLAVAGCILLGWLSSLPSIDFHGDDKASLIYLGRSALFAIAVATLTWRNIYPASPPSL